MEAAEENVHEHFYLKVVSTAAQGGWERIDECFFQKSPFIFSGPTQSASHATIVRQDFSASSKCVSTKTHPCIINLRQIHVSSPF